MATSKRCSTCSKELGPMYCTGCNEYFCTKDFRLHREGMFTEMDKIIEERNRLQDEINTIPQSNNQRNPLLDQIDQWRDSTIEKVNQVAAQVRQEAIQLLKSKQTQITNDFRSFSQELARLKETENFVEHDLTRLNQMIQQFKQELRQSTQPTTLKFNKEQSDRIDWNHIVFVEKEQIQQRETPSKFVKSFS